MFITLETDKHHRRPSTALPNYRDEREGLRGEQTPGERGGKHASNAGNKNKEDRDELDTRDAVKN